MNKIKQDNFALGLFMGIGSILISSGIIILVLSIFGKTLSDDPKILLFSFIIPILLMRWYVKLKYLLSARGIILTIVFGFFVLGYYLFKIGAFASSGLNLLNS